MPLPTRPEDLALISPAAPSTVFMFPEALTGKPPIPGDHEIFAFQYWPESLTDTEAPDYAEKKIPGASHPLFQWTGGSGRDISFTAHFTAEIDITPEAVSPTSYDAVQLLPSGRYTVDVRAAVARLKTFLRGDYDEGSNNAAAHPPKRVWLALENTRLGGDTDAILVILRQAPIVYQAWFPNGAPRIVEVACSFSECVQHSNADSPDTSAIKFIGRSSFERLARSYRYKGTAERALG